MDNLKRLVMVDSCILLEIILHQSLSSQCQDKINLIKQMNYKICVNMEILYEVMTSIHKNIDEDISNLNCTINDNEDNIRVQLFNGHISILKTLLNDAHLIGEGANYNEIRAKCNTLRIDNKIRANRDRTHIATAISNNCIEFVTKDRGIFEEKRAIKELSLGKLEISYIN